MAVPVIRSILSSKVSMLSVMLIWVVSAGSAPEATKVRRLPLTVMVLPMPKLAEIESLGAAPDSKVAPVFATDGVALLVWMVPPVVAST